MAETPIDGEEGDPVTGATAFEDGFLAVTDDGVVVRSSDGGRWEQVDTAGLTGGDRGVRVIALEVAGDKLVTWKVELSSG